MASNPFAVDWNNGDAVIAYAKRLGPGQVAYKHPARNNFNITHASRKDLYKAEWVIFTS